MNGQRGFTLIELILVTVIIGILAGAVVVNFAGRSEEARVSRARADIMSYQQAVDLYAIDNNDKYPSNLAALMGGKRKYLRGGVKKDPWGNDYRYELKGGDYSIYSAGPDGIANNADDITAESTEETES